MKLSDVRKLGSYAHKTAVSILNRNGMYSQAEILEKTADIYMLNDEAKFLIMRNFD